MIRASPSLSGVERRFLPTRFTPLCDSTDLCMRQHFMARNIARCAGSSIGCLCWVEGMKACHSYSLCEEMRTGQGLFDHVERFRGAMGRFVVGHPYGGISGDKLLALGALSAVGYTVEVGLSWYNPGQTVLIVVGKGHICE